MFRKKLLSICIALYSYNELVDFRNEHKFGPSTTSLIFVN